ncbi:MAG: hypothetical protein IAF38_14035 [Bacteroidia bacterium]|nr:hypothetical protein [Bacteroidia bacterium]
MKIKNFMVLGIALSIVAVACKTKQKTTTTTETVAPTQSLLEVATVKYPGISQTDLDEGKKIFTVDCVKCHGAKKIASRDETNWIKIIDWMAPKAKLTTDQKTKVLQYVLSQRALEKGAK